MSEESTIHPPVQWPKERWSSFPCFQVSQCLLGSMTTQTHPCPSGDGLGTWSCCWQHHTSHRDCLLLKLRAVKSHQKGQSASSTRLTWKVSPRFWKTLQWKMEVHSLVWKMRLCHGQIIFWFWCCPDVVCCFNVQFYRWLNIKTFSNSRLHQYIRHMFVLWETWHLHPHMMPNQVIQIILEKSSRVPSAFSLVFVLPSSEAEIFVWGLGCAVCVCWMQKSSSREWLTTVDTSRSWRKVERATGHHQPNYLYLSQT